MTGREQGRYASPAAVEAGIAEAAKKAAKADPSLAVPERIRLEYFNRFLSRVFSEGDDSGWVLKGGTSMLARVPSARATTDIDLFQRSRSLEAALDDLARLAAVDLGDFFRFDLVDHRNAVGGEQQPQVDGCRITFDVHIGVKKKGNMHVDLVVSSVMTGDVKVEEPAHALDLPKLQSHRYRLYPVVDQIADKVCATLVLYRGRPSSREKDLVDLVVLAVTQDVEAIGLRNALRAEAGARSLLLPEELQIPTRWGPGYRKLASRISVCEDHRHVEAAKELMRQFVDPVLDDSVTTGVWNHATLRWE
ncbi:nucleotidyl transferase AbiEii/AbiGii toxin family protein [Actinomyces sp.]|uniref:nucleotidyl transferase AbiEii/AbiGii toxin family protein n=1 Tax=Actinomyces sp. TaxID=29317 RepID=UPI00264F4181|nr:nucleotidyl transferase AbiEii/AbiGii toxin family protein [Actinomyces sp.]MDN6794941.1 nucleotidyl transferase AbiEii/AbiGii toxin family protein [Propionibacterium sp.]